MPKVTEVSPQKKNPKRFNIFLDGTFAFGADEDLVVDTRLVVGKEVDPKDLEKIIFEAEVGKLMERMYLLFGVRMRSEKEVRDYLKNLSFKRKLKDSDEISPLVTERLIEKLIQKGLVNDLEFAKAWTESRLKKKGWNVVKAELYQKGIDREIIEEVNSQQVTVDSQEKIAEKVLEKRLTRWNLLPIPKKKQKAIEFLLRRGFDYSLVKELVEKIVKK